MKVGIIGLGRMGMALVQNLLDHKYEVVAFNRRPEPRKEAEGYGAVAATSMNDFYSKLSKPKILWMMVTAGEATEAVFKQCVRVAKKGDIIIDGGNSFFKDTLKRGEICDKKGIYFFDAGTSGGIEGARNGGCFMIGGDKTIFKKHLDKIFKDIAVKDGYGYMGDVGSGHFVKMIHNGVEYGMLQSIGEGFEILEACQFDLDNREVTKVWANGSVVRGWLMDLMLRAFKKDPKLKKMSDIVGHSGEGKWSVQSALELNVPAFTMAEAMFVRFASNQKESFSGKVISALRNEFGGHIPPKEKK